MKDKELLFSRDDLPEQLRDRAGFIIREIDTLDANRLLNTSTEDLVEYFEGKFRIKPIILLEDQISVEQNEAKIDISQGPSKFISDRTRSYYVDGTRITYFLPYEGEKSFFYFRASSFDFNPPSLIITQENVQFAFDVLDHNSEDIKARFSNELENLKRNLSWINNDINHFNNELTQKIRQRIEWRKDKILKDQGLVSSLGFPLKKREDSPKTYVAPVTRKKIFSLPPATTTAFTPEPVLEIVLYDQILSIINNMVIVMERSPNAFRNMKEEDLRQHFLVQLNGQFEGQATGETFNYQGKTDILIREKGKNIFIAECKFWRGERAFLETIDQLLGYTSWRDTKTAILIFNRNKKFGEVVKAIPEITQQHPNFKRKLPFEGETSTRYVFHQNDDLNREIIITVMAFNVPGKE